MKAVAVVLVAILILSLAKLLARTLQLLPN
jgi:hypothetical protein